MPEFFRKSQSLLRAPSRARRKGFVAVALALSALFLLGMVGLAIDLGRMYVTKDEAQTFVDSAALEAALQLDDTPEGVQRALEKVAANRNRWQFGTSDFTTVTTTFGTTPNGPWLPSEALPNPPTDYYFARVVTSTTLPLSFLRAIVTAEESHIAAVAVAGRRPKNTFIEGLFPFSPYSHIGCGIGCEEPGTPFGMKVGGIYTLRWPAHVHKSMQNVCQDDRHLPITTMADTIAPSEDRGYIAFSSSQDLRQAIVFDAGTYDTPITEGVPVNMAQGAGTTEGDAVGDRVAQDTDPFSTTYAEYKYRIENEIEPYGNGRRVVIVPINNGPPDFIVAGFATFFLHQTHDEYSAVTGNTPICAEYVGVGVQGSPTAGGGPGGSPGGPLIFAIRLYH
ncbi:MAG TPA: Tad domain-containing protein [Bryobacteraceae bacterium]|nr:Tad domain-containing protein [Bryobacteraceae bacterium]HOL69915.1 Tad domain-containing protein [Bryobacteraceae bacterium]HOQ45851.1 Tad domain-containing protein [Bryobacteraceae bacterium]HPQ13721.1 Tad domain-containing protein [Bryobacteraceae bacterium]HPU70940.1 Tad domain-containing protein [Bryobacteraceae bacterium]